MLLNIRTQGFELTDAIKRYVDNHVRFGITRYSQRVSRVDVTLLDINGPKGGEDKRCRIKLKLDGMKPIIVQETSPDLYKAIGNCASRLKRTSDRHIDRQRQFARL